MSEPLSNRGGEKKKKPGFTKVIWYSVTGHRF